MATNTEILKNMAITKNEIPILEFDTNPSAVLMPGHEKLNIKLPRKAVFPFLGDEIDRYAREHGAQQVAEHCSMTKDYPIYVTSYKGQDICLAQAPVGAAAAAILLDWLIAYGAREIISAGSCGTLGPLPENLFLVPYRALRDEGASYHYAPPSRFIDIHPDALRAIEKTMTAHHLAYREVLTWSTDGLYRETKDMIAYRKSEGCEVVEMECAALAACAAFRGAKWGQILFTADTLADASRYDQRDFGEASIAPALALCLDAVTQF